MERNLEKAELQTCFACGHRAVTAERRCPRCSKPLQNAATIRALGGVAALLGFVISLGVGAVIAWHVRYIAEPKAFSEWRATPEQTRMIFTVMISILAFGLLLSLTGLCHFVSGRRHLSMARLTVGFGAALFVLVRIIAWLAL